MTKEKEEKKKPYKQFYDVKVECTVPAIFVFKVYAESPEEALELYNKKAPIHIQYKPKKLKAIKATIYESGKLLIKFVKNFFK